MNEHQQTKHAQQFRLIPLPTYTKEEQKEQKIESSFHKIFEQQQQATIQKEIKLVFSEICWGRKEGERRTFYNLKIN